MAGKTAVFTVRVTPEQKAFMDKKAGSMRDSIGAVVRGMIAGEEFQNEQAIAQLSPGELQMAKNCGISPLQYLRGKRAIHGEPEPEPEPPAAPAASVNGLDDPGVALAQAELALAQARLDDANAHVARLLAAQSGGGGDD